MCLHCCQQWNVKTSFRCFFVIGKWKSCPCIKKAAVTGIFIMWSFVRVQTILCSTLCYFVKWFNSRSFTKEQKNTCAIWSEERTTKRNNSDTIIMIVVVIMIIKRFVCMLNNKLLWTMQCLFMTEWNYLSIKLFPQEVCHRSRAAIARRLYELPACSYCQKTFMARSRSRGWIS